MTKALLVLGSIVVLFSTAVFLYGGPAFAEAASQGAFYPSSGANNASVGTAAWASPGNISNSDNAFASIDIGFPSGQPISNYLAGTALGFSVPSGAVIDGIQVEVELRSSADDGFSGNVSDSSVRLVKAGAITGSNKARASSAHWPTADTVITFGGPADLWSTTWTAAEINASNFGAAISAQIFPQDAYPIAYIDAMRITVFYTAVATPASVTSDAVIFE